MTGQARDVRIWSIIPAAGLSRRMGRPKQLLPYQGSTFAGAVARNVLDADVSGVIVVTRTQLIDDLQLPADPRVHIATNDDANSEMMDSIRTGLGALNPFQPGGNDGVLVVPGDMPTLSTQSCRACSAGYIANPGCIVVATYAGQRGHPIIFPFALRALVFRLHGGLRTLPRIRPEQTFFVDINDPGVTLDVDTARDYEDLLG